MAALILSSFRFLTLVYLTGTIASGAEGSAGVQVRLAVQSMCCLEAKFVLTCKALSGKYVNLLTHEKTGMPRCLNAPPLNGAIQSLRQLTILCLLVGTLGCTERTALVDLATLKNTQTSWNGRLVVVRGTLQTFDKPRHFWIEDDARNRVALDDQSVSKLYSEAELIALVGEQLEIMGEFRYQIDEGRSIRVRTITALREN